MIKIRIAEEGDWDQIWPIVHEVFQSGATYAYAPGFQSQRIGVG